MDPSLALSVIATFISGAALYVSIKQPLRAQRLSAAQVAAAAIIESVGAMREAVWASAADRPDPDSVARLAYDVDRTCRAHRTSLPRGLRGVGRHVRDAVGNYLGGASGYALDPNLKGLAFSDHERYWWDISITYLDYVVDTVGQWRNNPQVRRVEFTPFHEWRRAEDEAYRALSLSGAGSAPEWCSCSPELLPAEGHEAPASHQGT